jgi:hypothetical protein
MERNRNYCDDSVRYYFVSFSTQSGPSLRNLRLFHVLLSSCIHRSNRQIKSHGQKVATKYYNGEDIFQPLINYQSRNKPTVVKYLSMYKYPPKIDSMKPFFDSPIDSQSPAVENEKHESKTLAEILCSMKSRAK